MVKSSKMWIDLKNTCLAIIIIFFFLLYGTTISAANIDMQYGIRQYMHGNHFTPMIIYMYAAWRLYVLQVPELIVATPRN